MSDLNKKLEDAYTYDFTPVVGGQEFRTKVDVEAIKQAFIEDGWVKIPAATVTKEGHIEVSTDRGVRYRGIPLMTKEEWERQAVKDGWSKVDKRLYRDDKGRRYQQYTFSSGYVRIPEFQVMTGQEWYDRFEEALDSDTRSNLEWYREPFECAREAAQKASGAS